MQLKQSATSETWGDISSRKLLALCGPLGVSGTQASEAQKTLLRMMPFSDEPVPASPAWASDITDDHSPFEISVAVEPNRTDLRILVEAQSNSMDNDAGWIPAQALTAQLATQPGVSYDRFDDIQHLFAPDSRIPARFALWNAAVIPPDGSVMFKVYLNPQILGPAAAPGLVREALEILGVTRGWSAVQQLMAMDSIGNELLYFALDLADTEEARVKVYVAHHGVHAAILNKQLSSFAKYEPGHATWLARELADHDGPFDQRPVLTCLGFIGMQAEPEVTLHFPIRCYSDNDEVVVNRIERLIGTREGTRLRRAISSYACRPLRDGRGLVTYVSLRKSRDHQGFRSVVYLAPEVFTVQRPLHEELSNAGDAKRSGVQPTADSAVLKTTAS